MARQSIMTALVAVLLLDTFARADLVTLINPGTDDRIATITGVNINGTAADGVYDFTFHHGITYDDLEIIVGGSPITWSAIADLNIVLDAIKVAVNAFGDVAGPRTDDLWLPRLESGSDVISVFAINNDATNYSQWFDGVTQLIFLDQDQQIFPDDAYVTASPSTIPEAASYYCMGVLAFVYIGWKTLGRKNEAVD